MNSFQIFFAILGAVLYLVGFVPYVYHIFHGRVVPHAFSWTVWAILWGINTYILIGSQWLDYSLLSPIIRTIALVIGTIIAWFYIDRVLISRLDIVSIVLWVACLGIAYMHGANHAIIPTILVDILVLIPTLRKIHDDPDTEDAWTWLLIVFSQAATLLSLSTHSVENSLFWVYVMIMNLLVAIYITYTKKVHHRWKYLLSRMIHRLR